MNELKETSPTAVRKSKKQKTSQDSIDPNLVENKLNEKGKESKRVNSNDKTERHTKRRHRSLSSSSYSSRSRSSSSSYSQESKSDTRNSSERSRKRSRSTSRSSHNSKEKLRRRRRSRSQSRSRSRSRSKNSKSRSNSLNVTRSSKKPNTEKSKDQQSSGTKKNLVDEKVENESEKKQLSISAKFKEGLPTQKAANPKNEELINNFNKRLNGDEQYRSGSDRTSDERPASSRKSPPELTQQTTEEFGWPSWVDPNGKMTSVQNILADPAIAKPLPLEENYHLGDFEFPTDVRKLKQGKQLLCGDGWTRKKSGTREVHLLWTLLDRKNRTMPKDPRSGTDYVTQVQLVTSQL